MPHVSDTRAVSPDHDRHDVLLVAALAAGDSSGTDRDHALDLTRSCADCAELHDDLIALALASASAPPPVATRPRDFRLSADDAARLQPGGWHRILAALRGTQRSAARPLGAGLATLGLVGLLVANAPVVQLASPLAQSSSGGAAARPAPAQEDTRTAAEGAPAGSAAAAPGAAELDPVARASAAAVYGANGAASAAATALTDGLAGATGAGSGDQAGPKAAASIPPYAATSTGALEANRDATSAASDSPMRPANVLFGAAVVSGLGLLIWSRRRGRGPV